MECLILNETVNNKEALEQLSLFLYTMQNYERITTCLPISEELRSFDGISSTVPALSTTLNKTASLSMFA